MISGHKKAAAADPRRLFICVYGSGSRIYPAPPSGYKTLISLDIFPQDFEQTHLNTPKKFDIR
jgi:hypothetical protein